MQIKITNKGAAMGVYQIGNVLTYLSVVKNEGKLQTLDELISDTKNQLEKMLTWLDREDDGTISQKEINQVRKMGKEILKIWN